MIRRVAVLGCGGAGKTVLARRLGEALGLPVIHADLHREEWAADTEIVLVRSYAESDALVSSWRARCFGATMSHDSSTRSRSSSSAIASSRTSTAR